MVLPLVNSHLGLIILSSFTVTQNQKKRQMDLSKNCYANTFDFHVCIFTALGCYFCLNEEIWTSKKGLYILIEVHIRELHILAILMPFKKLSPIEGSYLVVCAFK